MSSRSARRVSAIIAALTICAAVALVAWQAGMSAYAGQGQEFVSGAGQQSPAKQVNRVLVHQAPDLSTMNLRLWPGSITAGGTAEMAVLVHYDGDEPAPTTTLRFYRSTDAVILPSDTETMAYEVSFLPFEIRKGYAYQFTAPASAGTHYYGACVDAVSDELLTANNCSDAVSLSVLGGR